MTSNFTNNRLFEETLEMSFAVIDGTFTTNGQTFILQHYPAVQSLTNLTSWSHEVLNTDDDNYFVVDYRWTFDNVTWTSWITMPTDFNNFLDPNTSQNIWFQIRYTFVTDGTLDSTLMELDITGTRTINPIFQPVVLTNNEPVVYTNQDTYKVYNATDFAVYLSSGDIADLDINFRYTQNQGRAWSPWVPLTAENLVATKFDPIRFCNFQFAFQNTGAGSISMFDMELIGEFQNVTAGYKTIARLGLKTQCNPLISGATPTCDGDDLCCTACSEGVSPWNSDIDNCKLCNGSNIQNLNDRSIWEAQIKLYEDLNEFQNQANSWKVTYALTDPDKKGTDVILHEHALVNVVDYKDLQMIVPDNQFPTDGISFSGMDLDLIQSFEVHITKKEFKSKFGVEFRPSKRDVLYLCDLNQLWEVDQMFPKRGFANAEIYYRVILKKYNDKANRNLGTSTGAKNLIDALTKHTNLDDLFGIQVNNEIKKVTKDVDANVTDPSQQYTPTTIISIRESMNALVTISAETIWNASLEVARSVYSMPVKSAGIELVKYNGKDKVLGKGDNRALSMWFKTEEFNQDWDWTLFSNYDYVNDKGYKLTMAQGAMTFTLNNTPYTVPVLGLAEDTWYCILANVDQRQAKLELAIYRRQSEVGSDLSDSKLVLFHKMIFDIVPDEFSINETMFIGGVDTFTPTVGNTNKWFVTNVRIYNQAIDKKKRNIVLNERVVHDAHLTILVDNAEATLDLPHYGNL